MNFGVEDNEDMELKLKTGRYAAQIENRLVTFQLTSFDCYNKKYLHGRDTVALGQNKRKILRNLISKVIEE